MKKENTIVSEYITANSNVFKGLSLLDKKAVMSDKHIKKANKLAKKLNNISKETCLSLIYLYVNKDILETSLTPAVKDVIVKYCFKTHHRTFTTP